MIEMASHACGHWVRGVRGKAEWTFLVNPATEEPLARVSSEGVDLDAALTYARDRGGPALRALTFRERGDLLRAVARHLHAHREELLGLSVANGGNTRADAKFDVDGATATWTAYADLGQELGDQRVLLDGGGIPLGRGARLFAQHLLVPRVGVAVQVNAFNFPAWGLAEKASCALLAGMPVVAKPATSTALVAHRIVELLVESKLLPEGALSLLCGAFPEISERLGGQDVLAFTGSGATAAKLRAGRACAFASTHVNVEADSLNPAILGPDVDLDSVLGELFLADVVRDMTQKAGQKCTAIRRVLVPPSRLSAVSELLRERLSGVRVGDPSRDEATMGPLATAGQLEDVCGGIRALARDSAIVCGGFDKVRGLGVDADRGYFVAPTVLRSERPRADDQTHAREVFGPVAVVMAYDGSVEQAAEFASWGGGALVCSVYTDDRAHLTKLVALLAPWHGRIVANSSKIASQAIPPGTVLPQLLHGGPGRAGGGEELGGARGLDLYMQRVALQGERAAVEAVGRSFGPSTPKSGPA